MHCAVTVIGVPVRWTIVDGWVHVGASSLATLTIVVPELADFAPRASVIV